jgi:hypothetical protein
MGIHQDFDGEAESRLAVLSSLLARQYSHMQKTRIVRGIVAASRIHHLRETLIPSLSKSKNVVLSTAETNVPGRKSIVIAAIVIIDAESRCVCSATFERINTRRSAMGSIVPALVQTYLCS